MTMADSPATASAISTFRYEKPGAISGDKMIVELAKSDVIRGRVQVVRRGGENNLHSHEGMDGFWMVLNGRVRFYGPGDAVIAELGRHEGILIPRGVQYWFESADESQDLELLQMAGFDKAVPLRRVDAEPLKVNPDAVEILAAPSAGAGVGAGAEADMRKYMCGDCDYIYDPAVGDPTQGIAPGTSFAALPESWVCPECGVGKEEFFPIA